MLANDNISNPSVTGTDDSATVKNDASATPSPTQIQLTVAGTGTYENIQQLVKDFERSIRPFDVVNLQVSGPQGQITFNMTVNTYFQPAKSLNLVTQEVK